MAKITVTNRQKAVRVPRARLIRLARRVAAAEGRRIGSLDIAVVSREEMAGLNRRWLGRSGATDVLSFDLGEAGGEALAGQIVVCADVAAAQARRRGHSAGRELMLYVVHGLLHLTGHDDTTAAAARRMHAREEELLAAFIASGKNR